jgi:tellurite resistance protein TerC
MMPEYSVTSFLPWILFSLFILAMLAIDLGLFHRKSHEVGMKEAIVWSGIWIGLALLFNLGIYFIQGSETALAFTAGYLIELSLSVDNLFVFLLIFSTFKVPRANQHEVLFWGIIGALVMRIIFIVIGIEIIRYFHWTIYILGVFLIYTAIKFIRNKGTEIHPEQNPVLKFLHRHMPVLPEYHEDHFFIKKSGKRYATQLFVVLVLIEATDVVFALDSIPAIFGITTDPFIVYTSNVFAILGLRSLFFVLSHAMQFFHYLHEALAFILFFIGTKMLLSAFYTIPIGITLAVIGTALLIAIIASLIKRRRQPR